MIVVDKNTLNPLSTTFFSKNKMTPLYLGVDLGTSSIKCSLANEEGVIIDSANESYPLLCPKKNWTEQNPDDWYDAMLRIIRVLSTRNDLSWIKAVSFCGQMHGLVILDENDKVIRPAILWNDSRVVSQVDYLNQEIGMKKLIEETSNIALCGFTAPKLLWLYENERENFLRIRKIMLPKDYLAYRMSKVFASDVSDLSGTLFFDVKNRRYSSYMLNLLHIEESQLPKVFESYEAIGTVSKEFASVSGMSCDTKVIIGGGDQAVGAIGTNTIKDNTMSISLGTSGVVFVASDKHTFDSEGKIHSFRHANGKFHLMGCTLSAAGSLKWWMEDVLRTTDYNNEIEGVPEAIDDILFLPYLVGERSPINDPNAKGYFANLNAYYKRENMTKAVLEGISFSLYDVYKVMNEGGIDVKEARVIGGGSKSDVWMQMLADIFNVKMKTISTSDGGTLGAIILAMVGDGRYPDVDTAASHLVRDKKEYVPDSLKHERYEAKFKEYKNLYLRNK